MKMKHTLIALFLMSPLAAAQTWVDFSTQLDTGGNLLGAVAGPQDFDLGAGCILTVTSGGTFNGDPFGPTTVLGVPGFIDNQVGAGSNFVTLSLSGTADWTMGGQSAKLGDHGASGGEFGTLTADGAWTITAQTNLPSLAASGGTITYDSSLAGAGGGESGTFDAIFSGSTFTYEHGNTAGSLLRDPFRVAIDNHVVVPEPSSALLGGLLASALLLRRKRS